MIKQGCLCRYTQSPQPVFAVWTEPARHGSGKFAVCREHLNQWLDAADEQPLLEPEALDFVVSRPPAATDRIAIGDWLLIESARRAGVRPPGGAAVTATLLAALAEALLAREALT